jgi:hypothetical protein
MTTSAETHKATGTKRNIVSAVRMVLFTSSFSSLDPVTAIGGFPSSFFSIVPLSPSIIFQVWYSAQSSDEQEVKLLVTSWEWPFKNVR